MRTNYIVLGLVFIGLMIVGLAFYSQKRNVATTTDVASTQTPVTANANTGCYVASLAKDVYTLNIESENNGLVEGTLSFKNFEKDSSSGTFSGTLANDILLGEYVFNSEGMQSNRQVIFKKVGDSFIEGFGDVTVEGNKEVFKDISTVEYDPKLTFVKSDSC